MPSLNDLVRSRTDLTDADLDWLHNVLGEWQLLSDLSFSDLVMWAVTRDGRRLVAVAQMRPTTARTMLIDDVVGTEVARDAQPELARALDQGTLTTGTSERVWDGAVGHACATFVPVRRAGSVIAVIARYGEDDAETPRSPLERAYLDAADALSAMLAQGRFPFPALFVHDAATPRVGDGLIRLDADGIVTYASPNAVSAYRRVGLSGDLVGCDLARVTAEMSPDDAPVDESAAAVVAGRSPRIAEVAALGTNLLVRAIPLQPGGQRQGALVLVRDVTEMRRRERDNITRDATIREIHHRVKNNLQTVAALLRLQARRLDEPEAREALQEAVRRVGSIAVVHETLSRTPDEHVAFDDIAERLMAMVVDVSLPGETHGVTARRSGAFGVLPADVATPLAMALTELMQNAVAHGLGQRGGQLDLRASRTAGRLRVEVADNGVGVPSGFDPDRDGELGLQIVRTLVIGELGGTVTFEPVRSGGTRAVVDVPVGGWAV